MMIFEDQFFFYWCLGIVIFLAVGGLCASRMDVPYGSSVEDKEEIRMSSNKTSVIIALIISASTMTALWLNWDYSTHRFESGSTSYDVRSYDTVNPKVAE